MYLVSPGAEKKPGCMQPPGDRISEHKVNSTKVISANRTDPLVGTVHTCWLMSALKQYSGPVVDEAQVVPCDE